MTKKITAICHGCGREVVFDRDEDTPSNAIEIGWNACRGCVSSFDGELKEWYVFTKPEPPKVVQKELF